MICVTACFSGTGNESQSCGVGGGCPEGVTSKEDLKKACTLARQEEGRMRHGGRVSGNCKQFNVVEV